MKKTISIVLFVALTAIALCSLCACGTLITYPDAGMYSYDSGMEKNSSQGFVNGSVDNIDIDWISGEVKIAFANIDEIVLTETSNKELDDKSAMHWLYNGDTLYVKYGAGNFYSKVGMKKKLTVTLPSEFACKNFTISMASGSLDCQGLSCDKFTANISSGDANLFLDTQNVDLDIASGNVMIELMFDCQSVDIRSSSGKVYLRSEFNIENLMINSSSGSVNVTLGSLGTAKVTKSSGDLDLFVDSADCSITCDLSSGNIILAFRSISGFTAKTKTSSGKVSCDYPVTKNGDTLVYGDGSSQLDLRTSSGKITIGRA